MLFRDATQLMVVCFLFLVICPISVVLGRCEESSSSVSANQNDSIFVEHEQCTTVPPTASPQTSELDVPIVKLNAIDETSLERLLIKFVEEVEDRQREKTADSFLHFVLYSIIIVAVIFSSITSFYTVAKLRVIGDGKKKSKLSKKESNGRTMKAYSKWRQISSQRSLKKQSMFESHSRKKFVENEDEVLTILTSNVLMPERSKEMRVEMPMTDNEFVLAMKKVIGFVTDYYRNPTKYPVSTAIRPNDIFNRLPQQAPEDPETFDSVWSDFNDIILRGCIQWQHPRFHAFFPCGRSYPDILAETVISSLGTVGITWAANPAATELDSAMVNWLGRALGIPERFLFQGQDTCESEGGGWLADTASDAIFCAMMAARHRKVEQELANLGMKENAMGGNSNWNHEKRADIISKLVAYGSYEGHSSFEKACKMACVRCRHIEVFMEDDWGMRREQVEKEMEKDRQSGLIPFYLHVALGTTSTASSDHLNELVPLREKYGVWIHVDAAYAGSAWVVEKYRNNEGIEEVDSININLHKFFLTSASITPFWTRNQKDYKEFFIVDPAYLKKRSGGNDLRNWGIQLTRRFKSLKVYFLLRTYGINGMRAYIERIIGMTEYMESLMIDIPNIRKFGQTNYGIFCIQYNDEGMNEDQVNDSTKDLCEFINNSHKMFFTHSNVRGHDIIRVAVTLERSTKKDVEESIGIFIQLVNEFKKKRDEEANHPNADDIITRQFSTISTDSGFQDVVIVDSSHYNPLPSPNRDSPTINFY